LRAISLIYEHVVLVISVKLKTFHCCIFSKPGGKVWISYKKGTGWHE